MTSMIISQKDCITLRYATDVDLSRVKDGENFGFVSFETRPEKKIGIKE